MKVALFGSNGYLGTQLAYDFSRRGAEVREFDVPECDVTESSFWNGFEPADYDVILFFAGKTGTEKSFVEADSFCAVNELGLLGLLKRLTSLGTKAPRVIFPSSRLVYRGTEDALKEDAPKEAKTVYAANKLACEYLLQAYHVRYGLPYSVVRICVPYGSLVSSDYSYGTIGFFMKQAEKGGPITLYGDGKIRRTFTYVGDISEAVYRLSQSDATGAFNIGGATYSLGEVAQMIAKRKGVEVSFVPWPDLAHLLESGSTFFDAAKLAAAVGMIGYRDIEQLVDEL